MTYKIEVIKGFPKVVVGCNNDQNGNVIFICIKPNYSNNCDIIVKNSNFIIFDNQTNFEINHFNWLLFY